jgi:hypothetical protein
MIEAVTAPLKQRRTSSGSALAGLAELFRAKRLQRQWCCGLALLAASPNGCTDGLLLVYGLNIEVVAKLINDGLATRVTQRVGRGRNAVELSRINITEAGRRLLRASSRQRAWASWMKWSGRS